MAELTTVIKKATIENRIVELLDEAITLYTERIQLCETTEEIEDWQRDSNAIQTAFSWARSQ